MASRLQDVHSIGTLAARPLATVVAPGTLYFTTDTLVLYRSDGTIWEVYGGGGSGGGGSIADMFLLMGG